MTIPIALTDDYNEDDGNDGCEDELHTTLLPPCLALQSP